MANFDVLITAHISEQGVRILEESGDINVDIKADINAEDLKQIIGNYDAVITRSGTTVTEDLLENPGKLKIIGRAGVGLDNVDIEAASKKGIIVMNAPTGNTLAATELTMGMMLAAVRKIPAANNSVKHKEWNRKKFMGIQLYGRTLGIVGLGRIGGNVAIRSKSFGMKVVAFDPYIKKSRAEGLGVTLCESLDEVLEQADVITFHTPLTDETKNMITKEHIDKMKDDVVIVNCARGGIVNEDDLYDSVKSGKVFSAAVDVFMNEPLGDHKLLELDNIFVTPHIGANTSEGQRDVAILICEQIDNALHGRSYENAVNIPFMKSQLSIEMQKYFEMIEHMGHLVAQVIKGRVEKIEVTMVGSKFEEDFFERTFDIPFNYQPFTVAALRGYLEHSVRETVSYINASFIAKDRNIDVVETRTSSYGKFNDLLVIKATTDKEEKVVGGTVFPDGLGRVVVFDEFYLDMVSEGTYIYFKNHDKPGIVGRVGTVLGEHSINIAGFELSRMKGGMAVSFVSVDNEVSNEALKDLIDVDGIVEAKVVKF
ncbi:phosphoglycerate dehydrogenase [Limisalsivibrio acetivorans]|uniref:phosphoglycerate dehydrogenase n=1 Tax=Limisalsivibrio acetivorans TaxID=1304888 RepID=UPI0003B5E758|nr:phosphoglycerate dehydrogenase [Limisalsivibrio acetivorans]